MISRKVPVAMPNGVVADMSFSLIEIENQKKIAWELEGDSFTGEVQGNDYFDCLTLLRTRFEKDGLKILCNGSRIDVYPSGMSRDMGRGTKAYLLTLGKRASRSDLVDIFDPSDSEKVGTLLEQQTYYGIWLKSLR